MEVFSWVWTCWMWPSFVMKNWTEHDPACCANNTACHVSFEPGSHNKHKEELEFWRSGRRSSSSLVSRMPLPWHKPSWFFLICHGLSLHSFWQRSRVNKYQDCVQVSYPWLSHLRLFSMRQRCVANLQGPARTSLKDHTVSQHSLVRVLPTAIQHSLLFSHFSSFTFSKQQVEKTTDNMN